MAEVLSPIMSEAIKNQVEYAKDEVVDALCPVIGKTIRKSLAEAMRNLVRAVNERIERTLSLRFLFKRIKARAAGVSKADLILKESLPFGIHQVFLIHRETGILLLHASSQSSHSEANQELISGMLTAIQDFARTLFEGETERDLNEIQYEDMQIRLEVGRYAYLAFVSSGIPPDGFGDEVAHLGEEIHKKFLPVLREFEGRIDVFQPAYHLLTRFIQKYQTAPARDTGEEAAQKGTRRGLILLFLVPLLLLGVYFGVFVIPKKIMEGKIRADLEPLKKEHVVFANTEVQFSVRGSLVTMTGFVSQRKQMDEVEALVSSRPAVKQVVNNIEVKSWPSDPERLHQDVERTLAGDSIDVSKITFVIEDGTLFMEGIVANEREKALIRKAVLENISIPVIVDNVEPSSSEQKILQEIEGTVLFFKTGDFQLDSEGANVLGGLLQKLRQVSFEQLYIIGHADDIGTSRINMDLSRRRAEWIKAFLVQNGIQEEKLKIIAKGSEKPVSLERTYEGRALNRRVVFLFHLEEEVP
jgi:outer membrane protein OmpA-like peptidoglycan-associated protein